MKLKYKKIIALTTMSTMGIGLLTLSISQDSSKAEESINAGITQEAGLLMGIDSSYETVTLAGGEFSTEEVATPTPTPSPTPTPPPIYDFEKEVDPAIQSLFEDYYTAKKSCDMDKLKSLISDPSNIKTFLPSIENLQDKTQYIDDYRNIKPYIKKSAEDNAYIAYVYHEIKFTGINTMAPGLSKFYLVKGEDGKYKIFSGVMEKDVLEYYNARNNDADVIELIDMTNSNAEEAKANDEYLKDFWETIDELAKQQQKEAKKKNASNQQEESAEEEGDTISSTAITTQTVPNSND
ncbi:MAG: hypothetical protein GX306_07930 [Clostridiales bacterium]|jgi:hypothetical protein|nr:hypothetical protein [Clostridiales bacterium]